MKTIEFKSNYGSFAYRMTAEVGENLTPGTEFLAMQGIANLCYRTVGSNVDKALGVKSKKAGGDGRMAVEYSEADGETINKAVSAKLTELEAKEGGAAMRALKLSFAVTGQHIFGESSDAPTKEATELWESVQSKVVMVDGVVDREKTEATFANALKVLGLGEDYDDASAVLACKRFLQAAKQAAKDAAKAKLG